MAYFLAPSLVRLRSEVNALWPRRSKASDGWIGDTAHSARKSDHNPDYSAGGIVRAIDVTNAGIDVDAFVFSVIRDARTRYVITRGRIWTREAGWRKYTGPNGHHHHVHVSVRSTKSPRYDLQAHAWGLSKTVGNNLSGGTVTTPNVPSAPAPILKGFLMTLSDKQQERLAQEVSALYQAMFYGSLAGGVKYPGLLAIEAETQKRVTETPAKVWATPIRRTDGPVSALQELADAKTLAIQAKGEAAGLRAALDAAAKGQSLSLIHI